MGPSWSSGNRLKQACRPRPCLRQGAHVPVLQAPVVGPCRLLVTAACVCVAFKPRQCQAGLLHWVHDGTTHPLTTA